MTEPNAHTEKPRENRRYSQEQFEILNRCNAEKDMSAWNQWREDNPQEAVLLEGASFWHAYLKGVDLRGANLVRANLKGANLEGARLQDAVLWEADLREANLRETWLQRAKFMRTHLQGAEFGGARLQDTDFSRAIVDGYTLIWRCDVGRRTKFEGVALDAIRTYAETKQLLECNIRRMNWEGWYKEHWVLKWPVRWFWSLSAYGLRTWRIILWFFGLAFAFALVYRLWPSSVIVNGTIGDIRGLWHAAYFSVVTMTTLGFGDVAANPDSWLGQTLLMVQVILGYVLLAALVTRFAVLFTAGGPAGEFADDEGLRTDDR